MIFLFNYQAKCVELYSVCDGVRDCLFGGDEGSKLCTKRFCKENLGGRWKCPNEAKCIFEFQVCELSENFAKIVIIYCYTKYYPHIATPIYFYNFMYQHEYYLQFYF